MTEMPRLPITQAYLAALRLLLPVREEPKGSNRGQMVEAFQQSCGGKPGDAWCLQVLQFAGRQMFGARWPLLMTGSTNDCAADAKAKKLRYLPSAAEPGDIVLLWHPTRKRFFHAAVLVRLVNGRWDTLEGNTNDEGSAEGFGFFAREGVRGRVLKRTDRLVKWHRGLTDPAMEG